MHLTCCLLFLVAIRSSRSDLLKLKRQPRLSINTTYQAEDNGITIDDLPQCEAWNKWWIMQKKDIDLSTRDVDLIAAKKNSLVVTSKKQLKAHRIPETLLDRYESVYINFEEVCRNHSRILWINSMELVRRYNLNTTRICEPYRKRLRPSINDIDVIINNRTYGSEPEDTTALDSERERRESGYHQEVRRVEQVLEPSVSLVSVFGKEGGIRRMDTTVLIDRGTTQKRKQVTTNYIVEIDEEDEHPIVTLHNKVLADHLELNASEDIFQLHETLRISLGGICNGDTPDLIRDDQPSILSFEEEPLDSDMGVHFAATDFDIEKLAKTLRNDTKLNDILRTLDQMNIAEEQPLASTFILPVLKRAQYDPRNPPTLFTGQTVDVRVGIHIQSMSNFELTTMDYDMDVWLRMAWRDPRLAHGLSRPILINEETFLKRIWRPDPFFANAKHALFHRVTYLNFYIFVFPDGEVFSESRLYLKPSCQLVLCKYPHDNQMCSLRISSLSFTKDVMHLRWFSNIDDAIRRNKVQLPELYIIGYSKHECNGNRKSGNFSCVEARFYMKRNLGYHMAQTYIPTAMCVVFSWISVWLPEEFVDGRIFVSLTVFLTLSAESTSVKEILPNVSYTKAIDIWFGFTATFVFTTMLQALAVISLEHNSVKLRKKAEEGAGHISRFQLMKIMLQSKRCHKLARTVDTYCKTLYPVTFVLFLIFYRFVIIEGEETKCLR